MRELTRRACLSAAMLTALTGCTGRDPAPTDAASPAVANTTQSNATLANTTAANHTEPAPPTQPKIRAVTDNLGHTFTFSDENSDQRVARVEVTDEVVVRDDMELILCVTDIDAHPDDTITHSYRFGDAQYAHPDNPRATDPIQSNCWSWTLQQTDYRSQWRVRIWIRNQDTINSQTTSPESDYMIDIRYTNLTLPH